jgi:hypothetical protein
MAPIVQRSPGALRTLPDGHLEVDLSRFHLIEPDPPDQGPTVSS